MAEKKVRVGVFGIGRGRMFARQAAAMEGVELVAICDQREKPMREFAAQYPGVATYTEYERFLEHDMDAVVLANYATEHAPAAIQAMRAGKHVQSENIAVKTMAEAVALVRAVEETGKIYMYAENCCYMNTVQEIRRLYAAGELGEFRYGEGEYVHPVSPDEKIRLSPTWDHWRNWLPATYYCTHAMGPLMYISRTRPVQVTGFEVPYDFEDPTCTQTAKRSDTAGIIICRMDNGGYVKLLQGNLKCHLNWYRIYGNRGSAETLRHGDTASIRVRKEPWEKGEEEPVERIYKPEFPEFHDLASRTGHGGGDFFVVHEFIRAIRTGEPPYLDVYTGLQMSCVGILAHRSALNNNATYEVPSFRDPAELKRWENDHLSPDPADPTEARIPASTLGEIEKPPEVRASFERRARELCPDWYE
ncbi:MAG TPA: Gfo/Idh/MocA family oxidoreductase [Armatimonadota bacterium]|nr:Gfo/Idh/MocA family oxidoreductase [Armatimonadota bacterium]